MLKQRITKAAFDALPDVMKAEYKVSATNAEEYLLDAEEAREALAARDRERARADTLQTQITTIQTELATFKTAAEEERARLLREKGDLPALERSWQTKYDALIADTTTKTKKLETQIQNLLVQSKAVEIATAISTVPALLAPEISKRLQADLTGDVPTTRVLDDKGVISALTLEELQKEFVANPAYATIIKGSGGSGGGAGGGSGGGGAGKKLQDMTGQERAALQKSNPAEFGRLVATQRAEGHARR